MSGSHPGHRTLTAGEGLYLHGDSVIHRLPAQVKIVSAVLLVAVAVATPGRAWPVLLCAPVLVLALTQVASLPLRVVARRLVVEVPFVVFALLLPIVATGPRVEVLGLSLSQAGLTGGGTLLLKATTGVLAGILLAATTRPRDLLSGLERLRLPRQLVAIASFMLRYTAVVAGDLARMRQARASRCYQGGRLAHLRFEAASAGTLFIRSYERGERVYLAMVSRGYTGRMPATGAGASAAEWSLGISAPLAVCALALVVTLR